jgi:hypothetical protein
MQPRRWLMILGLTAMVLAGILATASAHAKEPNGDDDQTPAAPADYQSQHFLIHTDLAPREARALLERLETMLGLISNYWGRPLSGIIECYVVRDLKKWPANSLEAEGREKIEHGAGVTISRKLVRGNRYLAKSVVYAVADHGTPQHEAVHAYCAQTFGDVGPTWYSEGMAEMGNYWRANDPSVQVEPQILQYLRESEPKSLNEIVNARELSGDSWQNYAWRWALCHLLANNTNYSDRFRPLGLALLNRQPTRFEDAYGSMSNEISFEYLEFVRNVEPGYRADLCSWDWNKRFSRPHSRPISVKVHAERGWQPTRVEVAEGDVLQFTTTGEWRLEKEGTDLTAAGNQDGAGKLIGVWFRDFELSEPFALGDEGEIEAPHPGRLYVRCQDGWGSLADNHGAVTLKIRAAKGH